MYKKSLRQKPFIGEGLKSLDGEVIEAMEKQIAKLDKEMIIPNRKARRKAVAIAQEVKRILSGSFIGKDIAFVWTNRSF